MAKNGKNSTTEKGKNLTTEEPKFGSKSLVTQEEEKEIKKEKLVFSFLHL